MLVSRTTILVHEMGRIKPVIVHHKGLRNETAHQSALGMELAEHTLTILTKAGRNKLILVAGHSFCL